MPLGLSQINKLRGRSARELSVRAQQEFNKLSERLLGNRVAKMSDEELKREFAPSARNGSGLDTATQILDRLRALTDSSRDLMTGRYWFPAFGYREEIVRLMETRFAAERQAIIDRAERARGGRFDLLGYQDLSFGDPIDWHLEPTSGKRTPLVHWSELDYLDPLAGGDQKVLWELNRHGHFITFGQAYWLTGDERFVKAFIEQIEAWMDCNPPSLGVNWSSSLEVSFRAIAWLWALHLCAGSPQLTTPFIARVTKYLIAHGRHIESYLSHFYSPNTHLTGEALGLFYLGAALPELRRARAWRKEGLRILLKQISAQLRGDGVYFEQTSYYHRYTADFYTHLLVLARDCGVNLLGEVDEGLQLLLDHLMWITRPDGRSPLFGDDDGGRLITLGDRATNDFRDTLATGAALFQRSDWKWVAGEAKVETLWLLGPVGIENYDQIVAQAPRERANAFAESGYFVMRDGWSADSSYALIDCGPHGAPIGCGHAHADALAIEFAACGQTWLVDPGTFVYDADLQKRDEFRSTAAHNTVTVDGQSQSVTAGPFSWREIADCRLSEFIIGERALYFEGRHNGYERLADPVTHHRAVLFVKADSEQELPAYLVVQDTFAASANHRYAIRFHFSAGCQATAQERRVEAVNAGGSVLTISVLGSSELKARVEAGWVSECYAQRAAAPVGVIEAEGSGPQEFLSLIFPGDLGRSTEIEQALLEHLQTRSLRQFFDFLISGNGLMTMKQERGRAL